MKITKTLYVKGRDKWRSWLSKNHLSKKEIWLIYYRKGSGKKRIPYEEAVQEALCFGWIDGIVKRIDDEKFAQRFSPRRKGSVLSELNKERVKMMEKSGKMTKFGYDAIKHHYSNGKMNEFEFPSEILKELKKDKLVWKNFNKFPSFYKKIRVSYIGRRVDNRKEFDKRLKHFIEMTKKNKTFGIKV